MRCLNLKDNFEKNHTFFCIYSLSVIHFISLLSSSPKKIIFLCLTPISEDSAQIFWSFWFHTF